ncbi:MAG: hypothetical protein ABWW65_07285 [Thermoprotei archaeon]
MNSKPSHPIIELDFRSRNLKSVIKQIKYFRNRGYTTFCFRERGRIFYYISPLQPRVIYEECSRKDELSGLKYRLKEARILLGKYTFIRIFWDNTSYRIKIENPPLTIRIYISNENLSELFSNE